MHILALCGDKNKGIVYVLLNLMYAWLPHNIIGFVYDLNVIFLVKALFTILSAVVIKYKEKQMKKKTKTEAPMMWMN